MLTMRQLRRTEHLRREVQTTNYSITYQKGAQENKTCRGRWKLDYENETPYRL
jgi:hypothetical protein